MKTFVISNITIKKLLSSIVKTFSQNVFQGTWLTFNIPSLPGQRTLQI